MDPIVLGSLIGGGFSLLGSGLGFLGGAGGMSDTQKNDQRFMNDFAWKKALRDEQYMRDYMQVRAVDAERAGFHPLAALGVNTGGGPSAAAFVGAGEGTGRRNAFDLGSDMAHNMGQNVTRAFLAQKSADERAQAAALLNKTNAEADYAGAMANEARKRTLLMTGTPPPMPGVGNGMQVGEKYQLVKNANGQYEWILSPEASQGIMSDPIKMWATSFENAFAGPDTRPFWGAVGRSGRRLLSPLKYFNPRNWRRN